MQAPPPRVSLQPRLKSYAITNAAPSAVPSNPDRPATPARTSNLFAVDPLSDKTTTLLIRRTLCSQLGDKGRSTSGPLDQILPPLTSSNEIDLQLYALIAIIIREFVHTWYTKITPDHVFVEEVVKIIAHCSRAIEQRLRKVDLESLIFDELPDLLDAHIKIYRSANDPIHPVPISSHPRQIYHSLWPYQPLSPVPVEQDPSSIAEQLDNEAAYRQLLVQGVLSILLPTEDLENDCLTSLVGQVISEMILGSGIGGKACEPWLLWEGITKVTEVIQARLPKSEVQVQSDKSTSATGETLVNITGGNTDVAGLGRRVLNSLWPILQYLFVAIATIRFIVITIAMSSSLPSRLHPVTKLTGSPPRDPQSDASVTPENLFLPSHKKSRQPIIKMRLWPCISNLLDVHVRTPWLGATLSMLQWGALTGPGGIGNTDGMLDRVLSHAIHTYVLDPALIPLALRNARAAVFPNNTLGPTREIPSASHQLQIRQRCAEAILSLIPAKVQDVYFGPDVDRRVREVEDVLDAFRDPYCNKHLLYGAVELIILRLAPEFADKGVEELLEERLS